MARRRVFGPVLGAVLLIGVSCGGGDDEAAPGSSVPPSTTAPATTVAATPQSTGPPVTRVAAPEGVESFSVSPAHSNDPVVYPQTPPMGGTHAPTWQACTFYDRPVPSETAVHSLEHGAIWVTYRPDLPADQIDVLARLARGRGGILASRWDDGLPAPVVVTSWGRQMKLETATDPRLVQFIQAFAGLAPEPNAPC